MSDPKTHDDQRAKEGAQVQVEALSREVERLTVLASRDRGLVESILDVSPYGIIVCDAQGRLTLQNKAAERIWAGSASADGVAEWGKYRGFHPDGRPYEGRDWAMARCLEHGETVQPEEMRIQRFDDSFGVLLGGSAPFRGPGGEIQGAVSIFADVTKLKETEEALHLESARYLTTLRSIGDAVIATDARGLVTFMNPIAERLTKVTVDAARGQPLAAVFRVGPEVAIDDRAAPILDDDGVQIGSVLVFRDVTEARREQTRRSFLLEATTLEAIVDAAVPVPAPDAARASPDVVAPSLAGLRVVLVDDVEDTRALLVEVLTRGGAEVVALASAAEALREIQARVPDVLVSDIGMPGEDGYALIRKVRAFLGGRPLPAVALTAYARRDDRTRALMAGFQSHVAKPVDPDELLVVVATLAGRTR